jgi:osmoprotectant transport system permease protein
VTPAFGTPYYGFVDPIVLKSLLNDVAELTGEHLVLVMISSGIAVLIGVTVGILGTRRAALRRVSLTVANVLQTIPSLALFGFLLPIPLIGGIGKRTAIISLVLYSLLPILRNTIVGIASVDAPVRESAIAMGMTNRQLLRMVELPLAAPTIIAGIRIALVTNIGTAVIAAVIGGGGLGVLIFRGVASVDTVQILAGAIPAAALALIADAGMGIVERRIARR